MNIWDQLPTPFTVLAPMEDVTDSPFRQLVASCAKPDLFYTEFTSTDGICSEGYKGVKHRLKFESKERPIIAQIWGNNPEYYFQTARLLSELGFDGIDINMGCPVPKVTKKGCCSALIDNPSLARELYLAACEGARELPVSIKTRLGFRSIKTNEWCGFLLELSPAALIVHGRVAKHMSKYPADWDAIGEVVKIKQSLGSNSKIVGNGDIVSYSEVLQKHSQYTVDGVMIGRGIFKNLFVFSKELPADYMDNLPVKDKFELLLRHSALFEFIWQGRKPFSVLKKYLKIYIVGFPGAVELRSSLMETNDLQELKAVLKSWSDCNLAADRKTIELFAA